MRCIKKTAVIIAFLVYSTGFLYAQESECDLENESRYQITTELRQTTGELHLRINETDAALYFDEREYIIRGIKTVKTALPSASELPYIIKSCVYKT